VIDPTQPYLGQTQTALYVRLSAAKS